MLNMDIRVIDTEDRNVKVTYKMREICGPYDSARYMEFDASYATGFTLEELIASCAVEGGVSFFEKYGKMSELVSLIIEEDR